MTPKEELESIHTQIKALEERKRAIYKASLAAPESEKVCGDFIASALASSPWSSRQFFPIDVRGINWEGSILDTSPAGRESDSPYVAIRPCANEHGDKTFLGIYVGQASIHRWVTYDRASGVMTIHMGGGNPAIWVPALNKLVLGCESWWGPIESEEDMRKITDEDINSVWYVQALKALSGKR